MSIEDPELRLQVPGYTSESLSAVVFYLGSKIDTDTVGTLCGSEFDLRTQKTFTASWHFL